MDQIKRVVRHIKVKLIEIFKTTKAQKGFKRYCLLACSLFILLTFVNFPYEKLVLREIKKTEGKVVQTISLENFKLSITGILSTNTLTLVLMNQTSIKSEELRFSFAPLNLLVSKNLVSTLTAKKFHYQGTDKDIKANLSGSCDLSLDSKTYQPKKGTIELTAKQVQLHGLKISGFPVPDAQIDLIKAVVNIDESLIKIKTFKFGGTDLQGQISGSITVNDKKSQLSKLNLSINIKSDSGIFEKLDPMAAGFLKGNINPTTNTLDISISGTFASPKVTFIK